jgi:hypothetical protein
VVVVVGFVAIIYVGYVEIDIDIVVVDDVAFVQKAIQLFHASLSLSLSLQILLLLVTDIVVGRMGRHIALVLFVVALQIFGFREILQIRHQKLKMDRMGPWCLVVDAYVRY